MKEIERLSAVALASEIRCGTISAREAVEAAWSTIERLDGKLGAFIHTDIMGARAAADACDNNRELSSERPLHGVPIAVKDSTETSGLRTTFGSTLYQDHVPQRDELSISRLRSAGAIIIGKTNTPEFGFGAVCVNRLCGPTRNPWDTDLTSGGSSGGSAVAVTTGMVQLAHGVDFGGSVRTPAAFCGCVGLRPTPGLIPEPCRTLAWDSLATQGVLARNVDDAALMLEAMSGYHRDDPTSHQPVISGLRQRKLSVAVSTDLNGAFPVDSSIKEAFSSSADSIANVFSHVQEAAPEVRNASNAFKTLRAAHSWFKFGAMVDRYEHELTESFVWNVRQGKTITAAEYLDAEAVRSRTYRAFKAFFECYDILIIPAASVLPFPNEQGEVWRVGGQPCESIIDYLACTYLISLVGFPVLTIPATWSSFGLPFGIQLIGAPGQEEILLSAARILETEAGFIHYWPEVSSS